jgi:predicted GIY-YIG superfamily endonuclease
MSAQFPSISIPKAVPGLAWVYILESADRTLYAGQTHNLRERLRKHRLGLGSKLTRDHPGSRLVLVEGPFAPDAAIRRERQLKGWSRAKKLALIGGDLTRLHSLARRRA